VRVFKDADSRQWDLVINVAAVKRVRDLLGLDLYGLVDDEARPLGRLLGDPCKLVDVLYVLCREQAQARSITDEDFGRGFSGDSLEAAADAFCEELFDFFPNRQARETLRATKRKSRELASILLQRADQKLAEIDLAKVAEELLSKPAASPGSKSENSFGDSPGSSASTPAPSPSES